MEVDWNGLKFRFARWVLGNDFVRDMLEDYLDRGVQHVVRKMREEGIIAKATERKVRVYLEDTDTVQEFLKWYTSEEKDG